MKTKQFKWKKNVRERCEIPANHLYLRTRPMVKLHDSQIYAECVLTRDSCNGCPLLNVHSFTPKTHTQTQIFTFQRRPKNSVKQNTPTVTMLFKQA